MVEPIVGERADLERLRGAANLASGHAASALAQMTGGRQHLEIEIPRMERLRPALLVDHFGGGEAKVAGCHLRVFGGMPGELILVFPEENALALADLLLRSRQRGAFDREARSALTETFGLVGAALLAALSAATGSALLPGAPRFVRGEAGPLLGGMQESGLHLLARFSDRPTSARGAEALRSFFGHLLLLPAELILLSPHRAAAWS